MIDVIEDKRIKKREREVLDNIGSEYMFKNQNQTIFHTLYK